MSPPHRTSRRMAAAVLGAALLGSCSGGDGTDPGRTNVTVLAASSLTHVLGVIEADVERDHPDIDVVVSFAGSSQIVAQVADGAPADIVITADTATMDRLRASVDDIDDPVVVATGSLAVAVAPGNPRGISGLRDLADGDLTVVVCASDVPCGSYAVEAARRAGITIAADSYEQNVGAVLTKVRLGEADAGIVYRSDVVTADGDVTGLDIPPEWNVEATYPMVVLPGASAAATTVAELLRSPTAIARFAESGFGPP